MKRLICGLVALGAAGFPGAALAQGAPGDELGSGSSIMWVTRFDGSNDTFFEYALGEGDGYILYRSGTKYEVYGPESYFLLVHGIMYVPCDVDTPSAETMASVGSLWPLEEGKSVSVDYTGEAAVIAVGEAVSYFLMGKSMPAHRVTVDYANNEDGVEDETLIVLDDMPVTAKIDWQDGTVDRVMLVTSPEAGFAVSPDDIDMMGNCASLLVQ